MLDTMKVNDQPHRRSCQQPSEGSNDRHKALLTTNIFECELLYHF
jgi:hypothetical protein